MSKSRRGGRPLRLDPRAESAVPGQPAFLATPVWAPVYHGFPVIPESETEGWLYGAITDYECVVPQTEGDGFVVAPDGSRAGIAWALDTPDFYEIMPADDKRWGVYGVRFPQPVGSLQDLIANFRFVLPALKRRLAEVRSLRET